VPLFVVELLPQILHLDSVNLLVPTTSEGKWEEGPAIKTLWLLLRSISFGESCKNPRLLSLCLVKYAKPSKVDRV
jgi:hypothetical protein